jgi:hypothetical protein
MPVDPYTGINTTPSEITFTEKLKNNRNPIVWIMFLSFWIVFFIFIMTGFVPDEVYANPTFLILMDILYYAFMATHIIMLLSPIAAMALYPEFRVILIGLGAVLWVLAAWFWFFVFPAI